MSMFVWADGTVTGSVNVEEHEAIQKALKPLSKTKLGELEWPIESAAQLADLLAAEAETDTKAAKASESKPAKAESKADADTAEALSKVDLPDLLDKATGKKEKT